MVPLALDLGGGCLVVLQPTTQVSEYPEFVGTGQFQPNPVACYGSRVFLAVLEERAFVEPFQQFGLAVLRKRLQEFDQKAPMRKKTTFQRKGERRCGLLRIFLRHFNSYVPSRKRISWRSCSLGSGIA
jgi:hypothetical protein